MNILGFKDEIIKINNNTYGYGNDILYTMAINSKPFSRTKSIVVDKKVLAGALWLIGRSYAASPQRRSYGPTKTGKTYKNKDGKDVLRPIWPVLADNDGREDFFLQIADTLILNRFEDLIKGISRSFEYIEKIFLMMLTLTLLQQISVFFIYNINN